MPKEVIQRGGLVNHFRADENGNLIEDQQVPDPTLQVKWNRDGAGGIDGWVQVQFEMNETYTKNYIGEQVTSDRLSRKEINHLIRTLRRARDAAYGSDE